jgi:biopolymer transport protein ExbD
MAHVKQEAEQEVGLQMAPMINVMLVMLSVFVATAGVVQREYELGVKVPQMGKAAAPGTAKTLVTIEISRDGRVKFNNTEYDSAQSKDLPELTEKLTALVQKFEDQPVVIKPNGDTKHERVIDVLNSCSAAGVQNISFGGGKS